MRERIIYECEHCNKKWYMSKYRMKDHEYRCWYNPKNKACNTCEYVYYVHDTRICSLGLLETIGIGRLPPAIGCSSWKIKEELEEELI